MNCIDYITNDGEMITIYFSSSSKNLSIEHIRTILYNKKISIGNVCVGMCIQNAIENKFFKYDFLKGEEDYKFHWANAGNSSMNIYCYRNRPASVVFYSINCLNNIGTIALR